MHGSVACPWGKFTVLHRGAFLQCYAQADLPFEVQLVQPDPAQLSQFHSLGWIPPSDSVDPFASISNYRQPWPGQELGRLALSRLSEETSLHNFPTYRLLLDEWFERCQGHNLIVNYFAGPELRFEGCAWIQRSQNLWIAYSGISAPIAWLRLQARSQQLVHETGPNNDWQGEFFHAPRPTSPLPDPLPFVWFSQRQYRPGQPFWGLVCQRRRHSQQGWALEATPEEKLSLVIENLPFQVKSVGAGWFEISGRIPDNQPLGTYWAQGWQYGQKLASFEVAQADPGPLSLDLQGQFDQQGLRLRAILPAAVTSSMPAEVSYRLRLFRDDPKPPYFGAFSFQPEVYDVFHSSSNQPLDETSGRLTLEQVRQYELVLAWKSRQAGIHVRLQAEMHWGQEQARRDFHLACSSLRLGLRSLNTGEPGQSLEVEVVVTDSQGRAVAGVPVQLQFTTQVSRIVVPEWSLLSEAMPVRVQLTAPPETHYYKLRAEARDEQGQLVVAALVIPRTPPRGRPEPLPLQVSLDRARYAPGEVAQLTIDCPTESAVGALRIYSGGLLEHRWLTWTGETQTVPIELNLQHAPTFQVEVSLFGPDPDGARGQWRVVEAHVDQPQRALQLTLTPRHATLHPNQQQEVEILVRDWLGQPVAGARIAVCAADRRTAPDLPDPVAHFYAPQPYRGQLYTSWHNTPLQSLKQMDDTYVGNHNICFSSGGYDNFFPSQPPPRREFAPTAFASADLSSDSQGRARVAFPVGERLASFQITVLAVSPEEQWGKAHAAYEVTQNLTLHPTVPLFLRPGDRAWLSILVGNRSSEAQTVQIGLRCNGSLECAEAAFECHLESGAMGSVPFSLQAGVPGGARVGVLARSESGYDHLEFELPVLADSYFDSFGSVQFSSRAPLAVLQTPGALVREERLALHLNPFLDGEDLVVRAHLPDHPGRPADFALFQLHPVPAGQPEPLVALNFQAILTNSLHLVAAHHLGRPALDSIERWAELLLQLVREVAGKPGYPSKIFYPNHRVEILWTAYTCSRWHPAFENAWKEAQTDLDLHPLSPELVGWEVLMERTGSIQRFESSLDILATGLDGRGTPRPGAINQGHWLHQVALRALLKIDAEHPLLPELLWSMGTVRHHGFFLGNLQWNLGMAELAMRHPGLLLDEQTLICPAAPAARAIDQGISLSLKFGGAQRQGNHLSARVGTRIQLNLTTTTRGPRAEAFWVIPLLPGLELNPPEDPFGNSSLTLYPDRLEMSGRFLVRTDSIELEGVLTVAGTFHLPGARVYEKDRLSCWGCTPDLTFAVTLSD